MPHVEVAGSIFPGKIGRVLWQRRFISAITLLSETFRVGVVGEYRVVVRELVICGENQAVVV